MAPLMTLSLWVGQGGLWLVFVLKQPVCFNSCGMWLGNMEET